MGTLNTNPENGRRSGDVWSVPSPSSVAVLKGDLICVTASGYAVPAGEGSTTAATFLGVADEPKASGVAKNIIVISKGVFPVNKNAASSFALGQALTFSDNNTVTDAASSGAVVATCYKAVSDGNVAYVKVKTRLENIS